MNVGLLFGSFNPIHVGHLIIAEHMCGLLDEVWFVISPQSPFKKTKDLLQTEERVEMIKLAIGNNSCIKLCTAELDLPTPSYTIDTLDHLKETHPEINFSLIMGSDNILSIHKWKSSEEILNYPIYVYPRLDYDCDPDYVATLGNKVVFTEAPIIELSATNIRSGLQKGELVSYMLHSEVWKYIQQNSLYLDSEL